MNIVRRIVPFVVCLGALLFALTLTTTTAAAPIPPIEENSIQDIEAVLELPPFVRRLSDFRVDNFTVSSSKNVDLTSRAAIVVDGDLYVVWDDNREQNWNIYLQRYNANGVAHWAADLQVNTGMTGTQRSPVIAYGDNFLYVAWQDSRNGDLDIYAQKISLSGVHDWSVDERVNKTTGGDQYRPAVAYGDDGSGVGYVYFVWDNEADIYAQKYLPNQQSVWTDDKPVTQAEGTQRSPSAVFDPLAYRLYIAWQDYRNGWSDIYAQKMKVLDGTRLWPDDGDGLPLVEHDSHQYDPEIALSADGQSLYAVWVSNQNADTQGTDIRANRFSVSDDGPESQWSGGDKPVNQDSEMNSQYGPSLAVDSAGDLYVAWYDGPSSGARRIYGQKLDGDNSMPQWPSTQSPADQLLSKNPTTDRNQWDPAIALDDDNDNFFVVWEDYRHSAYYDDVYGQKCDLKGVPGWTTDQRINTDSGAVNIWGMPAVAVTDDDNFYVAWSDFRNGESNDVFVQAYTSGGSRVLDAQDVRLAKSEYVTYTYRTEPSIGIIADHLYAVWRNDDSRYEPQYNIGAQKWPLDMSGAIWGAPGEDFRFNNFDGDHDRYNPIIVGVEPSGETPFLYTVWREDRGGDFDLYLQKRYDNNAKDPVWPADDLLVHDSTFYQYNPDAAVDAEGNIYIVWSDWSEGNSNIYARKITPAGEDAWGEAERINFSADSNSYNPRIAMGTNDDFYVVWEDYRDPAGGIYAQRFSLEGARRWASGDVKVSVVETTRQYRPDVAISESGYIYIVWEDWRNNNADIYLQILNYNGVPEEDSDVRIDGSDDRSDQTRPRIAPLNNEDSFFIAWMDRRRGNRHVYAAKWGHQSDLLDRFEFETINNQTGDPFPITINAIDVSDEPLPITATVNLQDSTGTIHPTVVNFRNQSERELDVTIGISATNVVITATYQPQSGDKIIGVSNAFNVAIQEGYFVYLPLVLREEGEQFISEETEPNDSYAQANGPLGSGQPCSGDIGTNDEKDFFFFNVTTPGNIRANLTGYTGDVWVEIIGPSGSLGDPGNGSLERQTQTSGKHYVVVKWIGQPNNSSYQLTVTYP
jgi:hypothetical protein